MPHVYTLLVTPRGTNLVTKSVTKEERAIRAEDYPSFGYWLQRRRKALDLTQAGLARRTGCSAATIRKIEADERKPSLQLAELLAEQLQLPGGQYDAFVQFARGVEVSSQTGLEALGDVRRVDLPPRSPVTHETEVEPTRDDSGAGMPYNLPAQTTPFFGRSAELEALAGFLTIPQKRLVTVLGPGGIGKTRLAIAAAEDRLNSPDSAQRFVDGIYFVSLAGVESADNLPATVAASIDFQFSGADDPQAQLLRYLHARHMLLVLDNFEHLLPGVGLVQAILDACPEVELLVTSREKLKLRSEQLLPISGLTYPPKEKTVEPEQTAAYSAMQLFVERAVSVRPSFDVSDDNLNTIATICRQVDGMPLGVVLAAAWLDTLTVTEIAREIDRGLEFLETELSDVPARQRSLHAAFKHSWRMLPPQEQDIYCQLSVFRGGFSAEAVEVVAGASLRDLQVLVNKSLLTRSPAGEQTTARYGIHELLRQFAEGELAHKPDLQNVARDRHSAYYMALLQRHEPRWHTDRQLDTLATIARESDNITAAWRRAAATGAWEHLAGAIDSWGQYHLWRGLFVDGNALCAALESRLKIVMDAAAISSLAGTTLWIKALAWHGIFLSATKDALAKLEESLAYLERQDPDSRQIRRLKAFVLRQMAWRLTPVARQKARHCAKQALQFSLQLEDSWQVAESHQYLGMLNWQLGQLSEARKSTEKSMAIFRELGDQRGQVWSNIILAWITQTEGDFASAERLRYEALDLCRRIGDRPILIYCTGDLARTLIQLGKLSDGLRSAEKCVAQSVEYGFREKEGWARSILGDSSMHLGQYERARREFEKALDLVKETGNQDVEMGLWSALGCLALIPGDNGREALAYFEQGLRLSDQVQDEISLGDQLGGLLLAACQMGAGDRARGYAMTYLEYVIRIGHYEQLFSALAAMAFYLAHFSSKQKALAIWQQASSHPYIDASKWYEDVIGREIEAQTADLSPQPTAVATGHDLWQTAKSLLADLK
jgi:predicted ATPase/transcriptional regulator with XRE-family HTH domain